MMTRAHRAALMAAITATDGPLDPAATFLGVFVSLNTDRGLDTTLEDMTLPTGLLATAVALGAWGTAHELIDQRLARDATLHTFAIDDLEDATGIAGWYLADAATAGGLLRYGLFDEIIQLATLDDLVSLVYRTTVDPNGKWDSMVVIDG